MPKRRTTLFLDDETVRHAQLLVGARSQSAVVQMALEKLIRAHSARLMGDGPRKDNGVTLGAVSFSRRPRLPGERG